MRTPARHPDRSGHQAPRLAVGRAAGLLLAFALATGSAAAQQTPAPLPQCPPAASADGAAPGAHEVVMQGVRLWYCVAGTGAPGTVPVVFLHGGPGQGSHHFAALAGAPMERSLRMVYFDQRASGRSATSPTREYTLTALVEDVEGLRRALGVPRIAVIGHSFGATLALEYAARYPEHVAGVVVAAGLWDVPYQSRLRCARTNALNRGLAARVIGDSAAADATRRGDCDWFWNLPESEREPIDNALMFPDSAVRIRLDSTVAASGLRNTGELGGGLFRSGLLEYRFAAPQRLSMPVLVISGGRDGTAVSEGLRELARRLPNATFREFEGSGHFVYLDETERFAREVAAFLARPPAT
jgi:proline iminopeptidase